MKKRQSEQAGYLLPDVINPAETLSVCVPVPNDRNHILAFLGQIEMLGYWWTWERDALRQGALAARVWRDIAETVRKRIYSGEDCDMYFRLRTKPTDTRVMQAQWMVDGDWFDVLDNTCCDQQAILHRTTNEGDLQVSYDNGTTWVQDPNDPRLQIVAIPPPVPGVSATKCDAASNGLSHLKDMQAETSQQVASYATAGELALAILGLIFSIVASGLVPPLLVVLVPVIIAMASTLIDHSQAEYDALFSLQVWDEMLCILHCNISDDGHFTQSQYESVVAQCLTDISGGTAEFSAARSLKRMIRVMGAQGLNNICSYGNSANSDCSSCNCTCPTLYTVLGTIISHEVGSCVWLIDSVPSSNGHEIQFQFSPTPGHDPLSQAKVYFTTVTGGNTYRYIHPLDEESLDFAVSQGDQCNLWGAVNTSSAPFRLEFELADPT